MKNKAIRTVYIITIFILMCSFLFFLLYSLNIKKRIKEIDKVNMLSDYYTVIPIPYTITL